MPQQSFRHRLEGSLDSILQAGAWLVGVVILFVVPPPRMTPADESQIFVRLAQIVAAVIIVLVTIAVRKGRCRLRALWIATLGALVCAVAAFFGYLHFLFSKTCEYDGRGLMVIGDTMVPDAAQYALGPPPLGCRSIIIDYAGDTEQIWPRSEILTNYIALSASFLATVSLFSLVLILAVELVKRARI